MHVIVEYLPSKLVRPFPVHYIKAVFVQYFPLQARIRQSSLKLLSSLDGSYTSRCTCEDQISFLLISPCHRYNIPLVA